MEGLELLRSTFKALRVVPDWVVIKASLLNTIVQPVADMAYSQDLFYLLFVFAVILGWQ